MNMFVASGPDLRATFNSRMICIKFLATVSALILSFAIGSNGIAMADESSHSFAESTENVDTMENADDALEVTMAALADEMAAIRRTKDPKERRRMMDEHRENMREALIQMREMGGEAMQSMMAEHMGVQDDMSPPDKKRLHRHKQSPVTGGGRASGTPSRMTDLELRLDMLQVMMESMVEQCAGP